MPADKKRILWLHTQPEFYHNLMLDDLTRGSGYTVPGMADEHPEEFEWIAGFGHRGPGLLSQNTQPAAAQTVFLRVLPGKEGRPPTMGEHYHVDWRADLAPLGKSPLGPDAIIVSGYGQRTFREILAEGRRLGVPVTIWSDSNLRADRGHGLKQRLKRFLKRRILRRIAADATLLTTANTRGIAYWRYYGGPAAKNKIVLSPCYSDYRRIDTARALPRAEVFSRFGLIDGDKLLFSPARLVPAKGLDLMIRAFRDSGMARRGWKYAIAGGGPLEAQLKQLAGDALGKSILLLGFQQPADNLALLSHAEVMVLPSRYEPHGIVVGEALAAGTPVLVSDVVGGAFGVVENGVSGLYFRNEDQADLLSKLRQLEDPALLAALHAAARPAFESWYRRASPMLVAPRVARRMLDVRSTAFRRPSSAASADGGGP